MPSYDFYSPFMSATIITQAGQRVPLWMVQNQQPATATQLAQRDRPYVQEVSVKLNMGGMAEITARLTPTYQQGLEYLNTSLSDWGASALEVVFGYATGGTSGGAVLGPRYSGLLVQPDIQIGADISVTLKAQGSGVYNLGTTGSTETLTGTREAIINQLLRGDPQNPSRMRVDLSLIRSGGDATLNAAYFTDQFSLALGGQTYWHWIGTLIWETRCWMFVDGDFVRVYPRTFAFNAAPKYLLSVFNFGTSGALGPVAGVFPIISVTSPTLAAYIAGALRGLAVPGTDPRTRRATVVTHDDQTAPGGRVGPGIATADVGNRAITPSSAAGTTPNGQQVAAIERSEGAGNAQVTAARAEWEALSSGIGVRLEIETLGIPDLAPGDVVTVQGLGIRVDGNYAMLEVTHAVSGNGMTTKLMGYKNVGSALQQGTTALGQINRRTATASAATAASGSSALAPGSRTSIFMTANDSPPRI